MQILEPSSCIAHYCLLHRIACGGMSHVYLAQDLFTDQLVAIKLVDRSQSEHCERLQREIRALAELSHDHILPALDYGLYDSWYYLVMPYIEHGTLRERLAQGPLTAKEAGKILEQLASALQFAHEHGFIHRDVKPSNILLRDGEHVYLTDFGLVKHIGEESHITQVGCMLGTPTYMAPELVEHAATTRSDIYALGIVLYQMLTGHVPFKSETPMGVYWKHLSEQPQPPSARSPTISPAIDAVVLHALEKNPLHRFATVREFAQTYRQALVEINLLRPPWGSTGYGGRNKLVPTSQGTVLRKMAVVLVAVIFFFVTPLWLGFTFYSMQYRPEVPDISVVSSPLTISHARYNLPDLVNFPPAPPPHYHLQAAPQPPTITPAHQPSVTHPGSPPPHLSPPPHKHRHKHKHKHGDGDQQEREHEHEVKDIEE